MKRYVVRITRDTLDEITRQMLHIADDSIANAFTWEARILAAIDSLGDAHGHAIDEDASERIGIVVRKMTFEQTYLIYYFVDENGGVVTTVKLRHGARLPSRGEA